jgi:hypothetical protein
MDAGFYRVVLASKTDQDSCIVYVPLDARGHIARDGVVPRLAKITWEKYEYWGEYEQQGNSAIFRWGGGPPSLTTFGSAPIELGASCLIYSTDAPDSKGWTFVIKSVERL